MSVRLSLHQDLLFFHHLTLTRVIRFQAHRAYIWALCWLTPGRSGPGLLSQHGVEGGVLCSAAADRVINLWRVDSHQRYGLCCSLPPLSLPLLFLLPSAL